MNVTKIIRKMDARRDQASASRDDTVAGLPARSWMARSNGGLWWNKTALYSSLCVLHEPVFHPNSILTTMPSLPRDLRRVSSALAIGREALDCHGYPF